MKIIKPIRTPAGIIQAYCSTISNHSILSYNDFCPYSDGPTDRYYTCSFQLKRNALCAFLVCTRGFYPCLCDLCPCSSSYPSLEFILPICSFIVICKNFMILILAASSQPIFRAIVTCHICHLKLLRGISIQQSGLVLSFYHDRFYIPLFLRE